MDDFLFHQKTKMAFRQAILMALDALERDMNISPRTSEIRAWYKHGGQTVAISGNGNNLPVLVLNEEGVCP